MWYLLTACASIRKTVIMTWLWLWELVLRLNDEVFFLSSSPPSSFFFSTPVLTWRGGARRQLTRQRDRTARRGSRPAPPPLPPQPRAREAGYIRPPRTCGWWSARRSHRSDLTQRGPPDGAVNILPPVYFLCAKCFHITNRLPLHRESWRKMAGHD